MADNNRLSKPGLIPLKVENQGSLVTTQVNKINFSGSGVTASIDQFNALTVTVASVITASYAVSSSNALTASYALNAGASFPYTGSAEITGSLGVTGSLIQTGSNSVYLKGLINQTTATTHVVTFNNTTGQLFITSSNAFGGGGGPGTPGGANTTIQFNDAGTLSGSGNFTLSTGNIVRLTGSLVVTGSTNLIGNTTGSSFTGSFTGSLQGTGSWAVSASQAVSSSYALSASNALSSSFALSSSNAFTASYAQTASFVTTAQTASFVLNAQTASYVVTAQTASYVLQAVSASYATLSNFANTASYTNFAVSSSQSLNAVSSSYALSSSYSLTSSYAYNASDIIVYVKNQSGNPILKGMVVRITGSNNSSDIPRVTTASYENDNNSANTLGIAKENISNGSEGYVITEGVLTGIDTNSYTSGQLIFLGATGSITTTPPQAPLHSVRLGEVIREQSNNGSIYVRIDNGYELGELHDVKDTTTTSSFGDLLIKSGSVWTNSKSLTGSYTITGSLQATSLTSSLQGTSSWAVSASNANSSSVIYIASNPSTDTNYTLVFKNNSAALDNYHQLASDGTNGPYYNPSTNILGGVGGITVSGSIGRFNTITGSTSITGSLTGSLLGTASFATTASYALSANVFPYTGSAEITGSLSITGSIQQTDSSTVLPMSQEVIYLVGSIGVGTTPVVSKALAGPISMFMDYQIVDLATGTNQRTGTIIANFNSAGTPTSTYNEIVTGDIGNTSAISFITATPAPYEIQAVNIGPTTYTFKGTLRYF
jgi:hypothetical protein